MAARAGKGCSAWQREPQGWQRMAARAGVAAQGSSRYQAYIIAGQLMGVPDT